MYQSGALAISEKIALGGGGIYSGGFPTMTMTCHSTKKPTTTKPTWEARVADEDCSVADMGSPYHTEAFEDLPDPGDVAAEILRLTNREFTRPRQIDRHSIDYPARRARHHDNLVREEHRLGDAVRDEKYGLGVGEPEPLQLQIELIARHGVERTERFVHQQ